METTGICDMELSTYQMDDQDKEGPQESPSLEMEVINDCLVHFDGKDEEGTAVVEAI